MYLHTRSQAFNVTGLSHRQEGTLGQDAFCCLESAQHAVYAVADGLGSTKFGGDGAKIAVESACHFLESQWGVGLEYAVLCARFALEDEAMRRGIPLRELGTTLIVARIYQGKFESIQVGDGGIVGLCAGELVLLSAPVESEFVNHVTPLTSKNWDAMIHSANAPADLQAIALFTDGLQTAVLLETSEGPKVTSGFIGPVFQHFLEEKDPAEIQEYLESEHMDHYTSDDRTLVLVSLQATPHEEEP